MVIPISVYKDNDYFNKIAIYFCLPVAIVNVIYYTNYLEFFTSTSGRGLYTIRFVTGAFKEFLIDDMVYAPGYVYPIGKRMIKELYEFNSDRQMNITRNFVIK